MQNIAVLIPIYNESKTIRDIIERTLNYDVDIIVVNDGSTDNSVELIKNLNITLIQNPTNMGKGAALLHGFQKALEKNYDAVITMDADNQHNPADIPRFIELHEKHLDNIIIGARLLNRENAPKERLAANNIADFFISWAASQKIKDTQSGFRLYPKKLLTLYEEKKLEPQRFAFEAELLIDASNKGFKVSTLPIKSTYPENSRPSHLHPVYDVFQIFTAISKKIIGRRMNISGLIKSLKKPDPS